MVNAGRILILPRGNWDSLTSYDMLDLVTASNNIAYLARQQSVGVNPITDLSNTYWQPFGSTISVDGTTIIIDLNGIISMNIDGDTLYHDSNDNLVKALNALATLSDVDLGTLSNGDALVWDATNSKFTNANVGIDIDTETPTFTEASTRANIASGETVSTLFGKIKKWFTDLKGGAFLDINVSGGLAKSDDLASIYAIGATNTTGATISAGTYFYLNGVLVRAKTNIANGASYTLNTNYEVVTAGALNELNNVYSTSETRVGTWIDGKPIYQKTVHLGTLPNATNQWYNLNVTMDKLIDWWGVADNGTNMLTLPSVSSTSTASDLVYQINVYFSKTQVRLGTGVDRSGYDAYITIQYTKTTD